MALGSLLMANQDVATAGAADAAGSMLGGASIFAGATPFGWAALAAPVLGKALAPSSAGPSRADSESGGISLGFDNSGWTVSTGASSAQGGTRGIDMNQWALIGLAALVVVGWVRHKQS